MTNTKTYIGRHEPMSINNENFDLQTYLSKGAEQLVADALPCPFSPYSDINVRDTSLREAINSRLFRELRDGGYLLEEHIGGCTLYEKHNQVEKIIAAGKAQTNIG